MDLVQGGAINAEVRGTAIIILCFADSYPAIDGVCLPSSPLRNSPCVFSRTLTCPHFPVQVIYGDTDSVMIYTATDDVREARDLGARIKREVCVCVCVCVCGSE